MITYWNFVDELLVRVPEFRDVYEEQVEDEFDDVPSHLLVRDLLRFTGRMYDESLQPGASPLARDIVMRALSFIEDAALSDDEQVGELVEQSFLGGWWELSEPSRHIRILLGPRACALLQVLDDNERRRRSEQSHE